MFNKLDEVIKRYDQLTEKLADPSLYDRQAEFKQVSEDRAKMEDIVVTYKEYKQLKDGLADAKEMIKSEKDDEMRDMLKEEIVEIENKIPPIEEDLKILLLPKDPDDDKNVMIEIRAGAGGDEASIFVGDVYRMYQNYLGKLGFKSEVVSISAGDEGIKEVIFSINGPKAYSLFAILQAKGPQESLIF